MKPVWPNADGDIFVSVNAGSSSLRLALHEVRGERVLALAQAHGPPASDDEMAPRLLDLLR